MNKKFLILIFLISTASLAQFGSGVTLKYIDKIKNQSGTDIVLEPDDKVDISYFSGEKALQSTVDGELQESSVTNTELGYVSGVTSSIQTQIDSKTPLTRTLNTTAPLQGGGTLEADKTLSITQSGVASDGYLDSTDWNTFNDKQDALTFGDVTESTSNVLTITGGTGAVIGTGTSIEVAQSTTLVDGFLSATDWNTFNNKQDALTFGDLTESTSNVLTITGGTGSVIGSGSSIQVQQSTTSTDGYLSSTDWNTFNSKQNALSGTNGDIFFWNTTLQNLGIGTNGQLLTVDGGLPTWQDAPVSVNVTTKGDIQTYSTAPDRLPVGTDGQVLVADSTTATGLAWEDPSSGGLPLLSKGSLVTSNGTSNGEFSACADGEIIEWDSAETNGFKCVTKPSSGTLSVAQSNYTSGSGTYTSPSGTYALLIEAVGGGGGGARVGTAVAYGGGGGGGGGYSFTLITSPAASYSYSVGAGGTGRSGSTGNGGTGGTTTCGTITASGGTGGTSSGNSGVGGTGTVKGQGGGIGFGGDITYPGWGGDGAGIGGGGARSIHTTTVTTGESAAAGTGGGGAGGNRGNANGGNGGSGRCRFTAFRKN